MVPEFGITRIIEIHFAIFFARKVYYTQLFSDNCGFQQPEIPFKYTENNYLMGLIRMEKNDIKDFQGFTVRNLYKLKIRDNNKERKQW